MLEDSECFGKKGKIEPSVEDVRASEVMRCRAAGRPQGKGRAGGYNLYRSYNFYLAPQNAVSGGVQVTETLPLPLCVWFGLSWVNFSLCPEVLGPPPPHVSMHHPALAPSLSAPPRQVHASPSHGQGDTGLEPGCHSSSVRLLKLTSTKTCL